MRGSLKRLAVPILAGGVAVFGIAGGASASKSAHGQHLSAKRGTIVAKGTDRNMRFSSTVIRKGGTLTIANHTKEPHTLSLVEPQLVPRTNGEIKSCFTPGHICKEIARWHQGQGNTVRAGGLGWGTEGDLDAKGDSVFFAPGQDPAKRQVRAPHGTVLHFICAIHPWMHGTITVK